MYHSTGVTFMPAPNKSFLRSISSPQLAVSHVHEIGAAVPGRVGPKLLRQQWVSLVVVVALVIGGFAISRLHGIFGSARDASVANAASDKIVSTNPKFVAYEIFGPATTHGMISYLNEHAQPQEATFASLPWSLSLTTTLPSVLANIVAQGDGPTIGCRIVVNSVIRDEQVSDNQDAMAFCLVKAA